VRATGAACPVRSYTHGGAVIHPVPDVRRRGQTVSGQRVVRRVAVDTAVPHFVVSVPLEAYFSGGHALRLCCVPGAASLVMLVHPLRHASSEMVRHERHI